MVEESGQGQGLNEDNYDMAVEEAAEVDAIADADADVVTVEIKPAEDSLLNTAFFWLAVFVVVYMIWRYWEVIFNNARRFISNGADDDEMRAHKLSDGEESKSSSESIGEKLKGFAKSSTSKIKKTLSGAAESM